MILQILFVTGLVLVHLYSSRLRFLKAIPRSRWLSLAGGISVAYVFMHIFPEIKEVQESFGENESLELFAGHHAYLIALFGLVLFYGLERAVKSKRKKPAAGEETDEGETTTGMGIFWIHIGSFSLYNALIGYLMVHREEQDLRGLILYFIAMALHFMVNDFGLRQDHRKTYHNKGRWILSAAIVVGWLIGELTKISESGIDALFAFLAGGVILNVLKEELPEERKSRFLPFLAGTAGYAALMLFL